MRSSRRCPTPRRIPARSWSARHSPCSPISRRTPKASKCSCATRRPPTRTGSFNSLLGDISLRVEDLLTAAFKRRKLSAKGVPYYAQMLVGMTVFTGQYWADRPKVNKEQLAAYIVDLAWHGLSRLDSKPILRFESQKAKQLAAKEDKERRDKERSETTASRTSRTLLSRPPNRTNRHTCPRAPADHQNRAQAGSPKNGGTDDGTCLNAA